MLLLSLTFAHRWCVTKFFSLLLNDIPQIITKETAIWKVRRPDVRCDVVAMIFSQPTLGSTAYMAWRRFFLPDIESSNNQSLNLRLHYALHALDAGLCVESKTMWEDDWRHNVTLAIDHRIHHDVEWMFGFHQYQYILWGKSKQLVVQWVYHLIWEKY